MPPSARERSPQERETLLYATAEQANALRETIAERQQQERRPGVRRDREIVAEAVATEFAQAGEPAGAMKHPWEHTAEEHTEAQQLVDTAFAQDLPAALTVARQSRYYPRNLDLFHDALTTELHELVREQHLNRQPLVGVGLLVVTLLTLVLLALLVLAFM